MEPVFFISPAVELLTLLILCYSFIACSFAGGVVWLLRYKKTKIKRSLFLGLSLIILPSILSMLALQLEGWWLDYRIGPDMICHFDISPRPSK